VTLLIHSPSALPSTEDGKLLASILEWVDERYPLAFSIVATSEPRTEISRSDYRDWVTLPRVADSIWIEAGVCAAKALLAYRHQLSPVATVFVGSGAEQIRRQCTELENGRAIFGEEILITSNDENSYGELSTLLDRVLPASLVVSSKLEPSEIAKTLDRQGTRPEIHLYWAGPLTSRAAEIVDVALLKSGGTIRFQFKLRDLLREMRESIVAVYPLLRGGQSRVKISIAAEDGVAFKASQVATRMFAWSGKA